MMKQLILALIFAGLFLLPCTPLTAANEQRSEPAVRPRPSRILILSARPLRNPWIQSITNEIDDAFSSGENACIVDRIEMRLTQNTEASPEDSYLPILRTGNYSAVVALMDEAVELVLKNYAKLPVNMPVILVEYYPSSENLQKKYANVTGFSGGIRLEDSIKLMRALYPKTQEIAILTDDRASGLGLYREAQKIQHETPDCKISPLNARDYTSQAVLDYVAQMPKASLTLLPFWRAYERDGFPSMDSFSDAVFDASAHPFFTVSDAMVGDGALGGVLVEGSEVGRGISGMLMRLFAGEKPSAIPMQPLPTRVVMDAKLFHSENLKASVLPDDAVFVNVEPTFFEAYPMMSAAAFVLLLLLTGLAIFFIFALNMAKKRHAAQMKRLIDASRRLEMINESQHVTISAIRDGLILTDEKGKILMFNPIAAAMLGCAPVELNGRQLDDVFRLVSRVDGLPIPLPSGEDLRLGVAFDMPDNTDLAAKDGSRIPVSVTAAPILRRTGETSGLVLSFRDMTEFYRLRDGLSSTKLALGSLGKLAETTCFISDFDGNLIQTFGSFDENWPFVDGKAVPPSDWIHPDDYLYFMNQWDKLVHNDTSELTLSYRSLRNNEIRFFKMTAKSISDISLSGGKRVCLCLIRDVTESGRWERLAKDSSALLECLLRVLPVPICVNHAGDGFKYVMANGKFSQFMGIPEKDLIGKTDADLFPPKQAEHFLRDDKYVADKRQTLDFMEEVQTQTGKYYIHTVKSVVEMPDGKLYVVSAFIDVSALEAAKQSESEFRSLFQQVLDHLPLGVSIKDAADSFRYVFWNQPLERMTGGSPAQLIGKNDTEAGIYPQLRDHFQKMDEAALRTGEPVSSSEQIGSGGTGGAANIRGIDLTKTLLPIESTRRYIMTTFADVSRERTLTSDLRSSETRVRSLQMNEQVIRSCLQVISSQKEFPAAIEYIMRTAAEKCGADRCVILPLHAPVDVFDRKFEWSRTNIPTLGDAWDAISSRDRVELFNAFAESPFLRIDRVDTPLQWNRLRIYVGARWDVQTLLLHLVRIGSDTWGVIALSFVQASRPAAEEDAWMMRNIMDLFLLVKEQARSRQQLNSNAFILQMIVKNTQVPIFLFDAHGKIVTTNPAAQQFASATTGIISSGRPCYEIYCGNSTHPENCPMRRVLATRKPAEADLTFGTHDMHVYASPIFDADGRIVYILENAVEMTEIKKNQRKLQAAMEAAQAADEAKRNFIATMNHELRTPLNSVIGFSELLQMGGLTDAEQLDYLQSINISGKLLLDLLNDILDISSIDSGNMRMNIDRTNCGDWLKKLALLFQDDALKKKINFSLTIKPQDMPDLYIDAGRIRQIIVNLVGNAIKFTHLGSVSLRFHFEPEAKETGVLQIEVEDTGIGIKDAFLSKIFEPFSQDEDVRKSRAYQGSGLGLAIVKKLVDSMNGEITVRSCENVGTVFLIKFHNIKYVPAWFRGKE